ncbi:AmmeMemoRadiSam system radical SAM enzyme [candidate division WOR-3 bacterium]|uniref:AmmeMemoRadiSam system radical SAM enzyme n=1 Tax=candidate division WOR-3 bacterium TaxID=2052148 RepID=A0A660SEG6_UNCW3|nr:MAG: AmmeMemoRadiSam system radical SAM enzyme [candidate division WOR-3 bacterium]
MLTPIWSERLNRRDFIKSCIALASLGVTTLKGQEYGLIGRKEARYYRSMKDGKVQCQLCPHGCIVPKGRRGLCRVRENRDGRYFTLVYGNPCAVHLDPIEKKPLFHFLPGTTALSIATAGCNFSCKYCQNWEISQARPEDTVNIKTSPSEIVDLALRRRSLFKSHTIAYTYTEPSIFYEFMLDTARLAKKRGIRNIYHSNGFLREEPLKELCHYLDGANIDLKSFREEFYNDICGGSLKPVLNTLKTLRKQGVHLEVTNLVVPTLNDGDDEIRDLSRWIIDNLGSETPVHFSRFYPMYRLTQLTPTPVETLRRVVELAKGEGLKFVYMGNVPNNEFEDTYCPNCGRVLINRRGYQILSNRIKGGKCSYCGREIPGVWS